MKGNSTMQLTIEVGRCDIPDLLYSEYSLNVKINKELSAATTFKPPHNNSIDFATKLFLRLQKNMLEEHPTCQVSVTGINDRGNRVQIAKGDARCLIQGVQRVEMRVSEGPAAFLQADLQFCASVWQVKQTKSINNRLSNFKSHLSQKQSSCQPKESSASKTCSNVNDSEELDRTQKVKLTENPMSILKFSKSQKMLSDNKEQLQNSAATTKHTTKMQQLPQKSEDSQLLLTLQLKIDDLQQKLGLLNILLNNCNEKLQQTLKLLQNQHIKNESLIIERQELLQLLAIEEEKNGMSIRHISKMNGLIQKLSNGEQGSCNLIEEKDQIIMLNQELEEELSEKNLIIAQFKNQLNQMREKIVLLETSKPLPTVLHVEPSSTKKIPPAANKNNAQLDKIKANNRELQKNINSLSKKNEELIKEVAKLKEIIKNKEKQLDTQKKKIKKVEVQSKQRNSIQVKSPREVKTPTMKTQITPALRIPKAKVSKGMKVQQKTTMQTQKKSHIQSSLGSLAMQLDILSQPNNLMINSRNIEATSQSKLNQPMKMQF